MKILFLFLFLISCTLPGSNKNTEYKTLVFGDDLTLKEFSDLLIIYAEQSPYPTINK
jgi:hypothetical protein